MQRQLVNMMLVDIALPAEELKGRVCIAHKTAAGVAESTGESSKPGEGASDKALIERPVEEACWKLLQVRQEYGVKKDLLGLLEGRETYVIGKDGIVKMVRP